MEFRPSRSQKKVIKQFNKYLNTGAKRGESAKSQAGSCQSGEPLADGATVCDSKELDRAHARVKMEDSEMKSESPSEIKPGEQGLRTKGDKAGEEGEKADTATDMDAESEAGAPGNTSNGSVDASEKGGKKEKAPKAGEGADASKPPSKKKKLLRLERRQQKLREKGGQAETLDKVGFSLNISYW